MHPLNKACLCVYITLPACHHRSNSAEAGLLKQLFAKYAAPAVDFILEGIDGGELVQKLKLTIPVTNLNLITQLCHLLDTLLLESGHYTDPNVGSVSYAMRKLTGIQKATCVAAISPHTARFP